MSLAGWIFMLSSWAVVAALTAWCFYRLMTAPKHFGAGEGEEQSER